MGENLMRMYHRKQIVGGAPRAGGENALQRGLADIIRDSEQREKRKDKDGESIEMKLLAEQLSRRLETKFERSHEMEKERERNETERRLRQIGESYEREIRAKEKHMERERSSMVERLAEREKKMMREVDLKMADRESRLELERRRLESRLDELMSGKEELDRARKELMTTVENEMDRLRQEKESLQERERRLLREEKRDTLVEGIQEQRQRNHDRIAYLEATMSQLRERLHKSEEERREANGRVVQYEATKAELAVAKNNYLRQLEESRRLGERLRERDDYEEMKMENERLKIELRSARRKSRTEEERERMKSETMEKLEMEATKNKEKELKIIISMMSEKIRGVTRERDYLRKECRELRKEKIEDRKREKMIIKDKFEKKTKTKTSQFSSLSEEEEDESVITSLSSFEEDINNIKKRINKINTISHELEETLHAVCILPAPERIVRERSRRRSAEDEDFSPIHHSLREKGEEREDTVVRERTKSTVSPLPPVDRYESMEREIMGMSEMPVKDSYHPEERRGSPPADERKDSVEECGEEELITRIVEKKEKEEKEEESRKEDVGSGMNMEGIDPVMAHYMKLVMEGRKKEKEEEKQEPIRSEFAQGEEEEEMEDFKFDVVETGVDDEGFEW